MLYQNYFFHNPNPDFSFLGKIHIIMLDIRKKPDNLLGQIIGSKECFTMEHRCLNGICFLGFSFLLICFVINLFISLPLQLILGAFLGSLIYGVLYYFCRFKKIFKPVYWLVLVLSCLLVCLTWFNAGGISGPFALIALMIVSVVNLISRRKELILSLIIIVFGVGVLFLIEYSNPVLTIAYQSRNAKYIDNYATFLLAVLTVCFIINFALAHYRTERKKSEEAAKQLEASEAHFRLVVENAPDAIFIQTEGSFKYINPATLKLFGAETAQEINGKPVISQFHPDHQETIKERIRLVNQEKKTIPQREETYLKTDGSVVYLEASAVPFEYQDNDGALVFVRDITEQKKADQHQKEIEKQLQQAQKMESLGLLAGGVAHDLNNVLSGIISYPDLLLIDLPEGSPLRKPILTIQKSGQNAADIVQDLLTLARRGVSTKEVVNLNDTISDYLKSPEYHQLLSFYPALSIETNFETALLNIKGSPIHLKKTIMNLVSNAAEAHLSCGKIFISTHNKYIDLPGKEYEKIQEGDYVVLEVADHGTGIAGEDLNRIFEPFYSKKVMGRSGTGLGMAVVWGSVQDHNGYINIESKKGEGTTFYLYFPVTREKHAKEKDFISIEDYMGNNESILVVDDIKEQREIATSLLSRLNYSVSAVPSGEAALEYLKDNTADLLLLDMIMDPGVDGLDTFKKILDCHPRQKAVIASGFSETDRVKEAQKLGVGQYIKKPYTLEKIGVAVKKELKK